MEILIHADGVEKVVGKLNEVAEQALTTRIPIAEIATDIFRIEKTVFSSGGRRGGGSWAVLKPDTVTRKGSSAILRDSGALYNSVTEPGAQFQILEIQNEGLVFGTERPWAFVQQYGSTYKNRPKRPFLRFLPSDLDRWTSIILNHITRPWRV